MSREVWARGRGVALVALDTGAPLTPGVAQALRDGVARGHEGVILALPLDARAYRIEAARVEVGVLVVRAGWPRGSTATVLAVAIDPARRGRGLGARALLLAERALRAEGVASRYTLVPRGNGHGLYFMLRCGYAPLPGAPPLDAGDVTWFARLKRGEPSASRARGGRGGHA